jgi:hypothetical protein
LYYVGEFHENTFQGLGKMIFNDQTAYYGSFLNNTMSSTRAVVQFGNGDKYKGQVNQNMKHGEGEYTAAY